MNINKDFNKAITGKTIEKVVYNAVNRMILHFTDGTHVEIWAECGGGNFDIPYFDTVIK